MVKEKAKSFLHMFWWIQSSWLGERTYFPEGSVFNIIVDLVDSRIMWSNSMKEIETRITSRFLSTELYVYSVMYDKESEI